MAVFLSVSGGKGCLGLSRVFVAARAWLHEGDFPGDVRILIFLPVATPSIVRSAVFTSIEGLLRGHIRGDSTDPMSTSDQKCEGDCRFRLLLPERTTACHCAPDTNQANGWARTNGRSHASTRCPPGQSLDPANRERPAGLKAISTIRLSSA